MAHQTLRRRRVVGPCADERPLEHELGHHVGHLAALNQAAVRHQREPLADTHGVAAEQLVAPVAV
jgi:hypothetical protein